jgi:purine-nucleoside/S-methyl-5'-thioadenosine phosphorylase / adenosine deaminase
VLERRVLDGIAILVSTDLEAEGCAVAFTERGGGVSRPPFDALNLSFTTDDPRQAVVENRARVCRALGIDRFALGQQVHGAGVARVTGDLSGRGFDEASAALPATDGLVTTEPRVALAVLVSDCVPVALASPGEERLAVVHAGWRGIVTGVVQSALRTFQRPGSVLAVVGPAIGPDHYEVGEDVAQRIADAAGDRSVAIRRDQSVFADLPAAVESILRTSGVSNVERADLCTACLTGAFFSHRRDGDTGRQALIAFRR